MSLLLPLMDTNKVILIDSNCPARLITNKDSVDSDINDYLSAFYPKSSNS